MTKVLIMPGCPECHTKKGLFSELTKKDDEIWTCPTNPTHKYKRDRDGNFHSV